MNLTKNYLLLKLKKPKTKPDIIGKNAQKNENGLNPYKISLTNEKNGSEQKELKCKSVLFFCFYFSFSLYVFFFLWHYQPFSIFLFNNLESHYNKFSIYYQCWLS